MIPIIIGAAALGSAAIGALAGAAGQADMDLAKKIGERAQKRHKDAVTNFQSKFEATNNLAAVYGQLQIRIKVRTIGRFVRLIERIGQQASQSDMRFLTGLDISVGRLQEYKATALEAENLSKGLASAASAGMAAGAGAVGVAQAFGTVAVPQLFGLFTTEVAVSQLGTAGVLTYLGGGSMALGGAVLGGIALGAENFRAYFAVVDQAIASGNNDQLALALNSITEIAKSSPFKDLANLASFQAALDDPNHVWKF